MLRAIYASPTLQEQVAAEMGRSAWSDIPPLGAAVLAAFGKDSKTTFRARLRKRKLAAYVWSFFMTASMVTAVYLVPAALMLVFVIWIGLGLLFAGTVGWLNEKEADMECVCCLCGLSTKQLRQGHVEGPYKEDKDHYGGHNAPPRSIVTHEQRTCSNCRGTAICKLGCPGCAASLVEATVVGTSDTVQTNTAHGHGGNSTTINKERKALAEALVLQVV